MNTKATIQGIFLTVLGITLLAGGISGASSVNVLSVLGIVLGAQSLVIGQGILLHRLFSTMHLNHIAQVQAVKEVEQV